MTPIPTGALLQKSKNGVAYVYFPSYYYDKTATTHNKEKQKRLYIGKVIDGSFVANKKFLANPNLSRDDVGKPITGNVDLSKISTRSIGATALLKSLADKTHLTKDLETIYGPDCAMQLRSLAMFMILQSESALSLYPLWQRMFWTPSPAQLTSQYTSKMLAMLGENESQLNDFFRERARHVRAKEYLSYDSTKIASTSNDISDVRWAPSKSGNYQQEVTLAILCGQKSRIPVMFRLLPGNVPDVKTVHDLMCRWDEIGVMQDATAVLDRGYNSAANLIELCQNGIQFVVGQPTSVSLVRECIEADITKYWESRSYLGEYNLFGASREVALTDEDGKQHSVWVHTYRSEINSSLAMQSLEKKLVEYEQAWERGKAPCKSSLESLFVLSNDGRHLVRNHDAIDAKMRYMGFFSFVSNKVKHPKEALAIYRGRDCIEKTFSCLQTGLDLHSAGVHSDATMRGKLLVCMVALTMVAALSYEMESNKFVKGVEFRRLYSDYTLKELLHELINIRLISSADAAPRLTEATQKQLAIYDRVGVPRPSVSDFTV